MPWIFDAWRTEGPKEIITQALRGDKLDRNIWLVDIGSIGRVDLLLRGINGQAADIDVANQGQADRAIAGDHNAAHSCGRALLRLRQFGVHIDGYGDDVVRTEPVRRLLSCI